MFLRIPFEASSSDGVLNVAIIGRISTPGQREEAIHASQAFTRETLERMHAGPMKITFLGEQKSGLLSDRKSMREMRKLVRAGRLDLVIAEDLGRAYRNPLFMIEFVYFLFDSDVRVICIKDNLDTAEENWEVMLLLAVIRHGFAAVDARNRVRRSATYDFHRGGMVQKVRYGYRKLSREEAASGEFGPIGLRTVKLPEATPTIQVLRQKVLNGEGYSKLSRWLNREGIPPGPYCTKGKWTSALVLAFLRDPILSGRRRFRAELCQREMRTGKVRRKKNSEPEWDYRPVLAHMTVDEQDSMWAAMDARKASRENAATNSVSVRKGIPRRATYWPGQAAHCSACGSIMYVVGDDLKCKRARPQEGDRCWCRVLVPIPTLRESVLTWLVEYCRGHSNLQHALTGAAWDHVQIHHRELFADLAALDRDVADLEKQADRVATAIASGAKLQAFVKKAKGIDRDMQKAQRSRRELKSRVAEKIGWQTAAAVESDLQNVLMFLAENSFEFGDVLRQLFPVIDIQPVQALDTSLVRSRARVKFDASALLLADSATDTVTESSDPDATIEVHFDLFEPALPIRILDEVLRLRVAEPQIAQRRIATILGVSVPTVTRALEYADLMAMEGIHQPYRILRSAPSQASRWRPSADAA